MRAKNLRLSDVFDLVPEGGVMTFAGERVVLMDAVALGLLRSQLVRSFGSAGARAVLTRFGYSHGWRMAEAIESGMVAINTGLLSTAEAPFGGVKESGLGREGVRSGMMEMTETRLLVMATPA